MLLLNDGSDKGSSVMFLRLTSDKADVFGGILKTKTRTMYWNKSLAFIYKTQQRFFLCGGDLFVIGVYHQTIKIRQRFFVDIVWIFSVCKINSLSGQRRGKERHIGR